MKRYFFYVCTLVSSVFIFSGCVQTAGQIGSSIDNIKETPVTCLSTSEIDTLISGKVIRGKSIRGIKNNIIFEGSYNPDGSKVIKLYKNGVVFKEIKDRKWLTKEGGLFCSEENGNTYCSKVCKFEDKYISVKSKDGKIISSWVVKE